MRHIWIVFAILALGCMIGAINSENNRKMNQYFETKIKTRKSDANGNQKLVTQAYIVEAISFTDAEATINQKMREYTEGEFKVTNIRATNYSEILLNDDIVTFFKVKVSLIADRKSVV